MSFRARVVVSAIAIFALCAIAGLEVLLQITSALVPPIRRATDETEVAIVAQRPDARLGVKGNPQFFDHDSRGFRNPVALDSASIVALGDSHTYGTSVSRDDAWPHQLSLVLDRTVYNMGMPGYGSGEALDNIHLALRLKPELVIFTLYFGNDFYNAFDFSKRNNLLTSQLSAGELASVDSLEKSRTIGADLDFLYASATKSQDSTRSGAAGTARRGLGAFLADHSRIVGLMRSVKNRVLPPKGNALLMPGFDEARRSLTARQLPYVSPFDGGTWKTLFTPRFRWRVEDDGDVRIRTGVEITKRDLVAMRDSVRSHNAEFLVLLLPTKEYVFWPRVARPSNHPGLEVLVKTEGRLHQEMAGFLSANHMAHIDLAPGLRKSLEQPFFPNGDGHPNPLGHLLIANQVQLYVVGMRNRQ